MDDNANNSETPPPEDSLCKRKTCGRSIGEHDDTGRCAETRCKRYLARVVGRPYEPGSSGNPRGAPASLLEFREKLSKHDNEALDALLSALRSADGKVSMMAVKEFYDRRWGKAPQALTDAEGKSIQFGVVVLPPESAE